MGACSPPTSFHPEDLIDREGLSLLNVSELHTGRQAFHFLMYPSLKFIYQLSTSLISVLSCFL